MANFGPHRTRADAIRASRRVTPRYRVPFPDLSSPGAPAPCSDRMTAFSANATPASAHPNAIQFPIGNLHKSSLQLITPGMIAAGEVRFMNGRKV